MTSDNPFVYGEIVTAGAFADREEERDRLSRDLAAGQKVFLISPRRYGKSSLIRDVMRGLARQRILTVEVTVAASSRDKRWSTSWTCFGHTAHLLAEPLLRRIAVVAFVPVRGASTSRWRGRWLS